MLTSISLNQGGHINCQNQNHYQHIPQNKIDRQCQLTQSAHLRPPKSVLYLVAVFRRPKSPDSQYPHYLWDQDKIGEFCYIFPTLSAARLRAASLIPAEAIAARAQYAPMREELLREYYHVRYCQTVVCIYSLKLNPSHYRDNHYHRTRELLFDLPTPLDELWNAIWECVRRNQCRGVLHAYEGQRESQSPQAGPDMDAQRIIDTDKEKLFLKVRISEVHCVLNLHLERRFIFYNLQEIQGVAQIVYEYLTWSMDELIAGLITLQATGLLWFNCGRHWNDAPPKIITVWG
jgi:hypothetical protein